MGASHPHELHIHYHCDESHKQLLAELHSIGLRLTSLEGLILATKLEHEAQLGAIADQLDKAKAEIVAGLADLMAAVEAAGNTTPGIDAAVARLQGGAQALDDLHVDPAP